MDELIFFFFGNDDQDDDGDNAFHIAADAAKLIRECLECIVVMLQCPGAAIEVRNHRQVLTNQSCLINAQDSCQSKNEIKRKKKKNQIVIIKILGMYVISSKSYIVEALLPNVMLSCAK